LFPLFRKRSPGETRVSPGLNDDVLILHVLQGRQDIGSLIQQNH
jgi:hypothetical protein